VCDEEGSKCENYEAEDQLEVVMLNGLEVQRWSLGRYVGRCRYRYLGTPSPSLSSLLSLILSSTLLADTIIQRQQTLPQSHRLHQLIDLYHMYLG